MFRQLILPRLVYWFYRLWSLTWRIRVDAPEKLQEIRDKNEPLIFAHWHRDELALVHFVTSWRIATMTSTSKDGQLIDYVIRRLGGATSKGSSTRGGAGALKGLTRLMVESGYRASMAVDGPKGPIYQVKPGVFELSQLAGAWIAPTGVAISSAFVFQKSWNKARLPKPFAKIIVSFGNITRVEPQDDARNRALALELAEQITGACDTSQRKIAQRVDGRP
jgi:lysophospholipid acyltransferase (LPLAT)-like uncharacterized protein